jgi:hypothetical protein
MREEYPGLLERYSEAAILMPKLPHMEPICVMPDCVDSNSRRATELALDAAQRLSLS